MQSVRNVRYILYRAVHAAKQEALASYKAVAPGSTPATVAAITNNTSSTSTSTSPSHNNASSEFKFDHLTLQEHNNLLQDAIRSLPSTVPPRLPNGRLGRQLISGLQVARLRKEVQSYGHEWPLAKEAKNPPVKFKGSKHLIKKKARADNIKAAMAEMPKKIADYYKQMRERRQHPLDLLSVIQSAGNPQGK